MVLVLTTLPVRRSRPALKSSTGGGATESFTCEPCQTTPLITNTSSGAWKPWPEALSHSFLPSSASIAVSLPDRLHNTTPSTTTSVDLPNDTRGDEGFLRRAGFFLSVFLSAAVWRPAPVGLAPPYVQATLPEARSRHATDWAIWMYARVASAPSVSGMACPSVFHVHRVRPDSASTATTVLLIGAAGLPLNSGCPAAWAATGEPVSTSSVLPARTISSAPSVSANVRSVLPVTASMADTGLLSPSGAYRRSPSTTSSLVTCGGPDRKRTV